MIFISKQLKPTFVKQEGGIQVFQDLVTKLTQRLLWISNRAVIEIHDTLG